jgi:hypothetical protein
MYTVVTSPRAIAVIREELKNAVLPHVTNQGAIVSLQMIDFTLRQLENAIDHQLEWMHDEITEIRTLGELTVKEFPSANAVSIAMSALGQRQTPTLSLKLVREQYELAGEVLSCVVEAVVGKPGPLLDSAMKALESRLSHETAIRGAFKIVGQD